MTTPPTPPATPATTSPLIFDCPECEAKVPYTSKSNKPPIVGEIINCPDCGAELEVLSVNPPKLALAPEVEEDWGE